jgi:hypothetical protein
MRDSEVRGLEDETEVYPFNHTVCILFTRQELEACLRSDLHLHIYMAVKLQSCFMQIVFLVKKSEPVCSDILHHIAIFA